jgi:hypothetical protein
MNTIQMYHQLLHYINLNIFFYLIICSFHLGTNRTNDFNIHNHFNIFPIDLFIKNKMFKMANFNLVCNIDQHRNHYLQNNLYLFKILHIRFLYRYLIYNVNFMCNIFLAINFIGHQELIRSLHQTFSF